MTRQIGLCRAFEEAAARTPPHTEQRFWAGLREKNGSIFVQDKERWSQAPASRPQSPAVRGFSRARLGGRKGRTARVWVVVTG